MKYIYFVTYFGRDINTGLRYEGNSELSVEIEITSIDVIRAIETKIALENDLRDVHVMFYNLLRRQQNV